MVAHRSRLPLALVVAAIAAGIHGADNCRFSLDVPLGSPGVGDFDWSLWVIDSSDHPRHFGSLLLEEERPSDRPIFVLGPERSGSTAVGNGLRRTLALEGYGECHTLPILLAMVEAVNGFYETPKAVEAAQRPDVLLGHVGPEEWHSRLAATMRSVYENLHHGGNFVDKTPGTAMIHSLHVIMSVWPQARVVFTRRRGLENVESRRRKFPEQDFVGHCNDWTGAMLTWDELKTIVPDGQRMEIDQYELVNDLSGAIDRFGRVLDLDSEQGSALRNYFQGSTPERTSSDWNPVAFDELSWSDEERTQFLEICGGAMETFGYTLDESYWRRAG